MEIRVFENATQVGAAGAALFAAQLLKKPDSVLGLATGFQPDPDVSAFDRAVQGGCG